MRTDNSEVRMQNAEVRSAERSRIWMSLGLGLSLCFCLGLAAEPPSGEWILNKVDENEYSDTRVAVSEMVIKLARATRTVKAKSWIRGADQSFTEFLYPERDKGTKMLKLGDELWMYTPETDRIIKISGHMLRQSVMGSDLSYEDMMEDHKLTNLYAATVVAEDTVLGRTCWVLELVAKKPDVSYFKRNVWVDRERFVPMREDRFGKSGTLLKTTKVKNVSFQNGRWVADDVAFKDALKSGSGTEFKLDSIRFNVTIPDYIFSKAALRK